MDEIRNLVISSAEIICVRVGLSYEAHSSQSSQQQPLDIAKTANLKQFNIIAIISFLIDLFIGLLQTRHGEGKRRKLEGIWKEELFSSDIVH